MTRGMKVKADRDEVMMYRMGGWGRCLCMQAGGGGVPSPANQFPLPLPLHRKFNKECFVGLTV